MTFEIGGITIGGGQRTFVVAEMAWSHDGSRDHALRIVEAAASAGADAVNLHLTWLPDYMVRHYGLDISHRAPDKPGAAYAYLEKISLLDEDWLAIASRARELGLRLSTMCNDHRSVQFAREHLDPDLFMIHPSCVGEEGFVRLVASQGRPVLLYVGGLTMGEIEQAVAQARSEGNERIILQHGFQSYPTAVEDNNLRHLQTLKQLFGLPVSFGDHTDGGHPLALVLPLLAVATGADVVEKHLTYDRTVEGEDYESALDPVDFQLMIERIRATEVALGRADLLPLTERELDYRKVVRKRAVAARDLSAGEVLSENDVKFKRASAGLYPEDLDKVLGRRLTGPLAADQEVTVSVVGGIS